MLDGVKVSAVYAPESLNELLLVLRRHPEAIVVAGGTYVGTHLEAGKTVEIVSLQFVPELHRIGRSDRYVDIGAAASIESVLRIGTNVLPDALTQALLHTAPTGVRALATVGGNLSVSEQNTTTAVAATALDARVELRRWGQSRWLPIGRFRPTGGRTVTKTGEILYRIRVPIEGFSVSSFRKLDGRSGAGISFCGLARINRGVVESLRIVFAGPKPGLIRHKDWEADIVGRRLPIGPKEAANLRQRFADHVDSTGLFPDAFDRERVLRLVEWFVYQMDDRVE